MNPKISIIIPVYNTENYIRECLDSILKQCFDNYEVICVDDGSADSSYDILKQYEEKDEHFRVYRQENSGASVARNLGIENAQGDFLFFLDSDDMLVDDALKILDEAIADNSGIEVLVFEMKPLLYGDEVLECTKNKGTYYDTKYDYPGVRAGRDFLFDKIEGDDYIDSAGTMLVNRHWLNTQNLRFHEDALFEDAVFSMECHLAAKKMIHLKEELYIYRVRANSIMTGRHTFEHERWRIWQFGECLRHIYADAENPREVAALSKYAKQMLSNIKCIYEDLDETDVEKVGKLTSVDGLIVESMGLGPVALYNKDLQLEGLLSVLKSKKKVLLYGAGTVGAKLIRLLKQENLAECIVGFAVSEQPEEIIEKDGFIVNGLDTYNSDDIDLLIISACNCHREMVERAKKHGFKDILLVDYNMEHSMERKLESTEGF